jgi:hypothetical protein
MHLRALLSWPVRWGLLNYHDTDCHPLFSSPFETPSLKKKRSKDQNLWKGELVAAAVVQQYQIGPGSHRHQNQRYNPVQHGPDPAKAQLHCSIKSHTTHTNWAHSEREETSGATTACTSSAPFLPNLSSLYLTSPVPSPGLSSTYNYNWTV